MLEAQNIRHEDFDVDRQPVIEQERLTVSKYIPRFLESKKHLASYDSYEVYCGHLGRILGPLPLDEITRTKIAEYKQIRRTEPIQRQGKPVEGTLVKDEVQRKKLPTAMIKIMGGRNKTKARQKVPISPELAVVLDELEKVKSLHGPDLVFTRDGKPIDPNALRKAFDRAVEAADIKDFHFHDLRPCSVTRWTMAGIPEDLRKLRCRS